MGVSYKNVMYMCVCRNEFVRVHKIYVVRMCACVCACVHV